MADHSVYELTDSEPHIAEYRRTTKTINRTMVAFIAVLVVVVAAMTLWAEPLYRFTYAAAVQAADQTAYARVVLERVHFSAPWTRPYDGVLPQTEPPEVP